MGINTHYYTVYGVRINSYDNDLSEAIHGAGGKYEVVEASIDLDVIMDGMDCNYMVIGNQGHIR